LGLKALSSFCFLNIERNAISASSDKNDLNVAIAVDRPLSFPFGTELIIFSANLGVIRDGQLPSSQ
jgi:hypothetical protein